jgi:hypothetical protein
VTSQLLASSVVSRWSPENPLPDFLAATLPRTLIPKNSPTALDHREHRDTRLAPLASRLKLAIVATQNAFDLLEFELLPERDRGK